MKSILRLGRLFLWSLLFEWKLNLLARASRRRAKPGPFRRGDFVVVPNPAGHQWIPVDSGNPSPSDIPWDRENDNNIRETVGVPWKIRPRPTKQGMNRRGPVRSCNWYSGLDTFGFRWSEFSEYATEFSPVIQALAGDRTEISIPIPAFVSAWKTANPKDQYDDGNRQYLRLGWLRIYASIDVEQES
jgi:hypothetical protein